MKQTLSEELITISTMLMVAHERGEVIRLAGELNGVIERAMEAERNCRDLTPKTKTSSATIKFTKKEIEKMSTTFKKKFIANGLVARIIKRPSGTSGKSGYYYEIRYRRNGYNISVSNKDLQKAKELFVLASYNLESHDTKKKNKTKFGTITDEWLEYKKGKITFRTWQNYECHAKRYITEDWRKKQIAEIRTVDLDRLMHQFDNEPRMYEEVRTLLNSIFKYAQASGLITHNPVTLIPFKRAKRTARESLSNTQAAAFLTRIRGVEFDSVRQFAYLMYFFGLRPCEIDEDTHVENGFLISRNRKRKGGKIEYKKIPIPKQALELIDFEKPLKPNLSYDRIADILKKALDKDFTPYNLRHTFATTCSQFVRQDIVEIWMGDSPERLVGQVYIHFSDEFMREQMDKVEFVI